MSELLKCPTHGCGRAGDDIDKCGSFVTCPKMGVPVTELDIVLRCGLCDVLRAVTAGDIMQGKTKDMDVICPRADCQAKPVPFSPSTPAATTKGVKAKGDKA